MKINLCDLFGVKEEEEFKLNGYVGRYYDKRSNSNKFYKICDGKLQCRTDNSNQWSTVLNQNINDFIGLNVTLLPKKKQFSSKTLEFFKMVDSKYKYIAKDKCGQVRIFSLKPKKRNGYWISNNNDSKFIGDFNDDLFKEILWEDIQPIKFSDYIKR